MAVYSDGHKTFMIKKGGVKKTDFTTFIESLKLSDNSILIMDNASIHKNLILKKTVDTCYTPPYSPEFNAIELCFAKVKRNFRRLNANHCGEIVVPNMISTAVNSLTEKDIVSCFDHVLNTFVRKTV